MLADVGTHDRVVVIAIGLARLILPLLIPRFPLAIVAALGLDAADNSLLARFSTERLTLEFAAAEFAALLAVNLGLVYLASRFIGERDSFPLAEGLFLVLLGTLILWLYDADKPLADVRFARSGHGRLRREA